MFRGQRPPAQASSPAFPSFVQQQSPAGLPVGTSGLGQFNQIQTSLPAAGGQGILPPAEDRLINSFVRLDQGQQSFGGLGQAQIQSFGSNRASLGGQRQGQQGQVLAGGQGQAQLFTGFGQPGLGQGQSYLPQASGLSLIEAILSNGGQTTREVGLRNAIFLQPHI